MFMNCDDFYYLANINFKFVIISNVNYWKIKFKNIRIGLKNTDNDFLLDRFQILAQTKQNNGMPRPIFGTVTVFIDFLG